MANYKIIVQYDGKNYSGWQKQTQKNTIQGCLEEAVNLVTGEVVEVVGSGRTDAGVSAIMQVANFHIKSEFEPNKLARALNARLPQDISVQSAEIVADDFNSRFCAKTKTYNYYFYVSQLRKSLLDNFALQIKNANVLDMQKACEYVVGTHDFRSFVARNSGKTCFERTVFECKIENVKDCLYKLVISGNGFLYNMVRIIMGTLILVGEGKRKPSAMTDIILAKDRTKAGKTVSPIGLVLEKVEY